MNQPLEFRIISQEEVNFLEKTPHNPPIYTKSFTEDDFTAEWCSVRTALKKRLELFGNEWQLDTDSGDFALSEYRGDSRWIYITFISTRLWRPEFIYAVADLLGGLPQNYRIGCLTELNDEEMLENSIVYLVISSTGVLGNSCNVQLNSRGVLTQSIAMTPYPDLAFP